MWNFPVLKFIGYPSGLSLSLSPHPPLSVDISELASTLPRSSALPFWCWKWNTGSGAPPWSDSLYPRFHTWLMQLLCIWGYHECAKIERQVLSSSGVCLIGRADTEILSWHHVCDVSFLQNSVKEWSFHEKNKPEQTFHIFLPMLLELILLMWSWFKVYPTVLDFHQTAIIAMNI